MMTSDRHPISLFGFLAGLVSGLAIAVAIALYLTHAPVPFINKVQQATENVTPESVDPNRPLFSPQIPSGPPEAAAGGSAPPPAAAGGSGGANPGSAPVAASNPAPAAPAGTGAASGPSEPGARVMLQVGAFRSADDADAVRARLALLGLDGKVFAVLAEGTTLYRVRLGPYGQLDDLNGIRRTLSENGMEPQIVHVR